MTYEESQIIDFLKGSPNNYVARREIARKAVNRKIFDENPHWVDAPLSALVEQHLVEQNDSGHYKLKKFEG